MTYKEILEASANKLTKPTSTKPSADMVISMDVGSTQTRSTIITADTSDFTDLEVVEMDTAAVQLYRPLNSLRTNNTIISNLETEVITPTTSWKFVKGPMRTMLTKESTRMASSMSKLDQETTYQSILFQCGLMALLDAYNTGTLAEIYNVKLTIAMPPEDLVDVRQERIKSRLIGVTTVKFPRLNSVINLNIVGVSIYAEPVAAAFSYLMNNGRESKENIVFIDCGGRSKGAILTKQGNSVLEGTTTAMGGGEHFLTDVAQSISARLKINLPNVDIVRDCLSTAMFNFGSEEHDIVEDIDVAKRALAADCADVIRAVLDRTNTKLEEIQRVVCTGRTFLPSVRNGQVVSPSLVEYVEREFKYSGVPIQFERYSSIKQPIVNGLSYYSIIENM
jgi:hypothetical protein